MTNNSIAWPDLTIDQMAWQLAKNALPEASTVSEIALRASEIKAFLGQNKEQK